jgi:cytosine/adenosine deaminase-related metal-dependent hydrolase
MEGTNMTFDLIVRGGTLITVDNTRRIIDNAFIGIVGDRITVIDKNSDTYANAVAPKTIDASGCIILPGLIDAHGHGGHSLLKTIASDTPGLWGQVVTATYFHFVTPEFWYAEGRLSALERLKFGVTCGLSVIGSQPRSDDPRFAGNHAQAYAEAGLRVYVAVGPCNPPWPRPVSRWDEGERRRTTFTFEDALAGAAEVVKIWDGKENGRIRVALTPFVIVPSLDTSGPTPFDKSTELTAFDREQSRRVREVARDLSVRIHSDAFGGMVRLAAQDPNGLIGPDVSLQHCTGLNLEEVRILADTGTSVGHAPMSGSLVNARCPVPELLASGANVALVTDGTSPRTSFDLLPQTRMAIRLQQLYTGDMSVLPPGKALEMITIDAAKALGLDRDIGSIESGKKADLILIDAKQPHLSPPFMPVHRVVFEAAGQDVATVIVNGSVLMENRKVLAVDENTVLEEATRESWRTIQRAGLEPFMEPCAGFWSSNYSRIEDERAKKLPV